VTRDRGRLALSQKTPSKPVLLLLEVRRSLLIPGLIISGSDAHTSGRACAVLYAPQVFSIHAHHRSLIPFPALMALLVPFQRWAAPSHLPGLPRSSSAKLFSFKFIFLYVDEQSRLRFSRDFPPRLLSSISIALCLLEVLPLVRLGLRSCLSQLSDSSSACADVVLGSSTGGAPPSRRTAYYHLFLYVIYGIMHFGWRDLVPCLLLCPSKPSSLSSPISRSSAVVTVPVDVPSSARQS